MLDSYSNAIFLKRFSRYRTSRRTCALSCVIVLAVTGLVCLYWALAIKSQIKLFSGNIFSNFVVRSWELRDRIGPKQIENVRGVVDLRLVKGWLVSNAYDHQRPGDFSGNHTTNAMILGGIAISKSPGPARTTRKSVRPKSVTYVLGTLCYPCVRAGPETNGAGGGNRTHGLGIMRPSLYH